MIEERKKAGLTQKQLSDKMGVPQSTLNRVESGETSISSSTIDKFCDALGLELTFGNRPADSDLSKENRQLKKIMQSINTLTTL